MKAVGGKIRGCGVTARWHDFVFPLGLMRFHSVRCLDNPSHAFVLLKAEQRSVFGAL